MSERTPAPAKDPPSDPFVGRVLAGKYRVQRRVARGGMSRVYLAIQQPLNRTVALKILEPSLASEVETAEFRARFLAEASICAKLRHPNTVTVFDFGVLEGEDAPHGPLVYMVMEFVEGRNLAQELRGGPLRPERAVRIAFEVCRALQEAHELGVVHRDLKCSNIMLDATGEGEAVKVVDFGIAHDLGGEQIPEDKLVGTPRYMAPEVILRERVDARADLYSLGVVMFEMLTATSPFKGEGNTQTMMAHLKYDAPSVRESCPNPVPDSLVALVGSLLAKRPGDRPPSAAVVRQALHRILLEMASDADVLALPTGQPPPPSLTTGTGTLPRVASPPPRRKDRVTPIIGVLLVASLLLLGVAVAGTVGVGYALLVQATSPAAPPAGPVAARAALTLVSDPNSAEVWENGEPLGFTPIDLELAADGPVRTFELRLEGYETTTVVQGPSAAPVRVESRLVAKQDAPVREVRVAPATPPPPRPGPVPVDGGEPPVVPPSGPLLLER